MTSVTPKVSHMDRKQIMWWATLLFVSQISSGLVPTIPQQLHRNHHGERGRVSNHERLQQHIARRTEYCRSPSPRIEFTRLNAAGSAAAESAYPRSKYNLPILLTLFLSAASALLFRDVIAIMALHEYDSMMEADWIPESAKLLTRLPSDLLEDYGNAVKASPLFVKACTSGVAYLLGDVVAQAYEGRRRVEYLDLTRTARNSVTGFLLHGPMLHYWIEFLEGPVTQGYCGAVGHLDLIPNSAEELGLIVSKIVLDQTLFALALNTGYIFVLGVLVSRSLDEISTNVKDNLVSSVLSSWRFWPLVHLVSYSPIVAVDYKLLFIDVMEIFWVAILSLIANDEKKESGIDQSIVVYEGYDVRPADEIIMVSQFEKDMALEASLVDEEDDDDDQKLKESGDDA